MRKKARTVTIVGNVLLWGMSLFGWTYAAFEVFG